MVQAFNPTGEGGRGEGEEEVSLGDVRSAAELVKKHQVEQHLQVAVRRQEWSHWSCCSLLTVAARVCLKGNQ